MNQAVPKFGALFIAMSALSIVIACSIAFGQSRGAGDYNRNVPAARLNSWSSQGQTSSALPGVIEQNRNPSTDIRIKLNVNRTLASPGDTISLVAEVDRDCYLTIITVGEGGRVVRLWPTSSSGWNGRIAAGQRIQVPGPTDAFEIRIDGPSPMERIIALAATANIFREGDFHGTPETGVSTYHGDSRTLLNEFRRAISQFSDDVKWGTAETAIQVGPTGTGPTGSTLEDVIVEMRVRRQTSASQVIRKAADMRPQGFQIDPDYEPVPLRPQDPGLAKGLEKSSEDLVIVRGRVPRSRRQELAALPGVVRVWRDTPVDSFQRRQCPIPPCDCKVEPKGTIDQVAQYLGVKQIWRAGFRGKGVAVGVVDNGITATGRYTGSSPKIKRVSDGWPSDWGTKTGGHGNMCATDVLGMAPDVEIYDMRYGGRNIKDVISNIIESYNWALQQFKKTGKPQILTNSWGIFEESWDRDYAKDPNHPFIVKMLEVMDQGMLVLFSAGNCGEYCADSRCKKDQGPGRSMWGANGHLRVISVGAVNLRGELIGYSSQGPAALDPKKPDICAISHFKGYYPQPGGSACDSGTSAACPIAAGVVALLKEVDPQLKQDRLRKILCETARDIGPAGWDQHSGHGILQAYGAFQRLGGQKPAIDRPNDEKRRLERDPNGWYKDD